MSMIKVENLTFSYPSGYDSVFENVSFQIDTDWKLGFVGRNGRGKTTFLNLLLGKYEYSGKIISSVKFDYFPYEVADESAVTCDILEEICPAAEQWEIIRELSYLGSDADILYRPFCTLSNGERTKALLSALFLNEGHFLLIDEPTNHLDAQARQLVSDYLKRKKGFILVSHDRRFLDGCVDHILSINRADIEVRNGNFSVFMENFERQQESEAAKNDRLRKDIKRLSESSKRVAAWSDSAEAVKHERNSGLRPDRGFVGHKVAKTMKRAKSIEYRQQQAIEEKQGLLKNLETAESLKISPLSHHCDTLISFDSVEIDYGGGAVCAPVSFSVKRGERTVLDGRNGSGKSSILKLCLENSDIPHTGTVTRASGLVISYVPQDTSFLRGTLSELAEERGIDESLFKAILRKMDFERAQFEKDMSDFSGGQKKKALIAASLCEKAHLYIWDEPLNFIDVYSRMQIENLIKEFEPTMLLVEHDRAFREAAATMTIEL